MASSPLVKVINREKDVRVRRAAMAARRAGKVSKTFRGGSVLGDKLSHGGIPQPSRATLDRAKAKIDEIDERQKAKARKARAKLAASRAKATAKRNQVRAEIRAGNSGPDAFERAAYRARRSRGG